MKFGQSIGKKLEESDMEFKEYGEYDPKIVDFPQEIQFMNSIKAPLNRVNHLMKFIEEKKPDILPKFVKLLQKKISETIKIDYFKKQDFNLSDILKELNQLKTNTQLVKSIINFVFNLLQLPNDLDQKNDKIEVTHGSNLRSFLVPRYYNVMVLSEIFGKEEAIKFYKVFRTDYTKLFAPRKNMYKDTTDMFNAFTAKAENEKLKGVFIMGTPENGKLFSRKDFCVWAEALKDYPDKDFKYLAACYGDFQGASTMQNENFILTMKNTIMQGDAYCSAITHDTRVDWNLYHPDETFWDTIHPLKEWQLEAKKERKIRKREFQQEFEQLGFHSPETLDRLEEIQPLNIATLSPFPRLNLLLDFLKRNKPEILDSYIQNLLKSYAELIKVDYFKHQKYDINDSIKEFEYLKKNKQLAINSLNYYLGLLELPLDVDWVNEKVKVPLGNHYRSFLIPNYQNVRILADTIGREEAVRLFKMYVTERAKIATPEDRRFRFETLTDLRKDDFEDYEGEGNPGWVRIEGIVKDGKFVYRKDSCLYAEAMKDYPDGEFKFLAACYYDYQGTTIQWNKDFILTMEHTIAEGDPYCSCVVHDTRIDWDLTHPSEEYWDTIWPLQKWQKKNKRKKK
jgi:hypothetical protein